MDEMITCPVCHQPVKSIDYFCPNCGKNLRPAPLSTSVNAQIVLYLKSLLLPPMGIVWGLRYLRQSDSKSKIVGLLAIVITIVEIVWVFQATVYTVNTVNQQVNQQVRLYSL